jgi:ABC-type multidrug transport system permease subunit
MLSSSLKELIKCRWREFCREPSALFFVVLMPILWMLILGFALSEESTERYGVGWSDKVDQPRSERILEIKKALVMDDRIILRAGSEDEIATWMRRGDILVTVVPGADSTVYEFDPVSRESRRARDVAQNVVQNALGRKDVSISIDQTVTIPGTRYVDFLIPGLLAFSIMSSSLFGTGMTIVSNRRENILKRYLATPMRPYEYIVSHIIGRGFVLAAEFAAVLVTGILIFSFHMEGNWLAFILLACLGTAALTSLALFCACRTSNTSTYNGMTNLIVLPMMLLSGVWFSRGSFPSWLVSFSDWLPLTPLVEGLRRIALEGATLVDVQSHVYLLIGYTLIFVVGAKSSFKWY